MWKNKECYVDEGGVLGLSIIKHVTLQKIVAHDFRYDPRIKLGISRRRHTNTECGDIRTGHPQERYSHLSTDWKL